MLSIFLTKYSVTGREIQIRGRQSEGSVSLQVDGGENGTNQERVRVIGVWLWAKEEEITLLHRIAPTLQLINAIFSWSILRWDSEGAREGGREAVMTAQQKQVWPFGLDLILTRHVNNLSHTAIERGSGRGMKRVSLVRVGGWRRSTCLIIRQLGHTGHLYPAGPSHDVDKRKSVVGGKKKQKKKPLSR